MIFIFAANYARARSWAQEDGLTLRDWRYVSSPWQLRGQRGAMKFRMLDGWEQGFSKAEIVDIFQQLWINGALAGPR